MLRRCDVDFHEEHFVIVFNVCFRMEMTLRCSVLETMNLRTASRWTVTSEWSTSDLWSKRTRESTDVMCSVRPEKIPSSDISKCSVNAALFFLLVAEQTSDLLTQIKMRDSRSACLKHSKTKSKSFTRGCQTTHGYSVYSVLFPEVPSIALRTS